MEGVTLLIRQWGECIKRRRERWNGLVAASERGNPHAGKAIRLCAQEIRKFRRKGRRVARNFRPLEGRATFYLCIN